MGVATTITSNRVPQSGYAKPDIAASSQSWAVVSFLFEDAVWCDWLYREFDGERIPRPLLGRPSRFGTPYPERISVSPDPADPFQLETYADTLLAAQHLILVISPTSGSSPVLSEHLRAFKASGGEERIIAMVVKGEPASPSAEPGSEADRAWLPKWLDWRFENNRFNDGGPSEPLVIDARLGVSSLAEVRARIMAALLEVDREELNELGIVTRPTASLAEFPMAAVSHAVPPPSPSTAAFVEIAETAPVQHKHARWPIWLAAVITLSALIALAVWPTSPIPTPGAAAPVKTSAERAAARAAAIPVPEEQPLVETRIVLDPAAPTPAPPAPSPEVAAPPIPEPGALTTTETPEQAMERIRVDLVAKRDRLTRQAEQRMANGDSEEAMHILDDAIVVGKELVAHTNQSPTHVLELCLLYRRVGTLAAGISSTAVARNYFEEARRALLELRTKGRLPKDAVHTLASVENTLRELRNQ